MVLIYDYVKKIYEFVQNNSIYLLFKIYTPSNQFVDARSSKVISAYQPSKLFNFKRLRYIYREAFFKVNMMVQLYIAKTQNYNRERPLTIILNAWASKGS